ncbi:MAG: GNAT family N-acetyltransferase [Candidatus Nanopelagicales bacterium]
MATVRVALPGDAEAVSRVHVLSWQAAYAGLLPADFLAALSVERRLQWWSQELVEPHIPESRTYVLDIAGAVAGFANLGPGRADEDRQTPEQWELYAIYLLPEHWGAGNGRLLLETALGSIPRTVRDVSLWVMEPNARARAFYERHGFHWDGTRREHELGGQPVIAVRYLGAVPM